MPHRDVFMAGLQKLFAVLLYLTALSPNCQGQTTSTWLLSGAMDIYIGLDSSGSITDAEYAREKNDTLAFIRQLPVKPNGTWVGVRPFSYDVADTEISLTGNMTILEQGIPNLPRMKGNTDISNFLLVAIGKLMSASTRNVLKCIVIFTDGYSRYPSRVASAVDLATKNNIQIFAVPVGSHINVPSLNNLVGANNNISSAASLPEDLQTYVQVEEARLAATDPTTTPFVEATPTGSAIISTSTSSSSSTGQSPVKTTVSIAYTTSQEYVTSTDIPSQQPKENSTLVAASSTSQSDGTNTRTTSVLPSNSSSPSTAGSSQPDVSRAGASELTSPVTATSGNAFEAYNTTDASVDQPTTMSSQNGASTTASIGTSATTNSSTVTFTSAANSSPGNSISSALSSVSNLTTATPSSVGNSTATTPNSADTSTTVISLMDNYTTATPISVPSSSTAKFNSASDSTTATLNSAGNSTTAVPNSIGNSTTAVPSSTSNSTKAEFNSAGNSTTVTLNPVGISTSGIVILTDNSTSRATTSTGALTTPTDNSSGNLSSSTVVSSGNFTSGAMSSVSNSFSGSVDSFGTSTPATNSISRVSSSSSLASSSPISASNVSVGTVNSPGNLTSSPSQSLFTSTTTTVNSGGNDSLTATSQRGDATLARSTSDEVSATNTVSLLSNSTTRTVNPLSNSTSAPANSLSNFTVSTANSVNTTTSATDNSAGTTTTAPSAVVNNTSSATSSTGKSTITAVYFGDNSTTITVTSLGNSTSAETNSVSNFTLSAASSAGSFPGSMANVDGTSTASTTNSVGNYTSNANSSSGPNSSGDISPTTIRSVGNSTPGTTDSIGASTFNITNLAGNSTAATSLASTSGDTSPSSANVQPTYSFASTTAGNNSSGDLTASTHFVTENNSDVTQTLAATGFTEKRNSDLSSAGPPSATAVGRTSTAFTVSNTESRVASSDTTPGIAANITVSSSTSDFQDAPSTLPLTMNASTTKNGSHSDVSGSTVIPGGTSTQAGTPFYPDVSITTGRSTTIPLFNFTNIIDTTRPSTYPELTSSRNTMGTSVTPRADDKTPIGQAGVGITEPAVRTGTTMDMQTGHETMSGTSRDASWTRDWTPTTDRGLANVSSERQSSDPNHTNKTPSDADDTTPSASITGRATTPAKSEGICASKELVVTSGVGHLRHPYRCDLYIQCYKSPDGNVIAVTRQCKPGLLWNPTLGACDWAYNVNCPTDKCRTSSLQNYKMEGNCRAFWSCHQGRSVATCCKPGAAYFPGQGCVACANCLDPCPEKCRSGDVCKVRPVWGSPYNYQIDLGLFGSLTSTCLSGTFNLASCSCSTFNTFSTRGCSLYLSLTFNDAGSEYSKIQMNNLLTDRGSAVFMGNSAVTVPFSPADTYLRLAEKPLVLRFRYMELSPLSMLSVLVRSTPCETGGHLVLYADDDGIYVKIFSQQGEVASATLLTKGFVTTTWKMLEVRYMVNQLTVSVTSGSLTYMSSVKIPISLSMAECGWTLGHPVNIRQLQGYTGRMDDVQIFYCAM